MRLRISKAPKPRPMTQQEFWDWTRLPFRYRLSPLTGLLIKPRVRVQAKGVRV